MYDGPTQEPAQAPGRGRATMVGLTLAIIVALSLACGPADAKPTSHQARALSSSESTAAPRKHHLKADPGLPQVGQVCTARSNWRSSELPCWSNVAGPPLVFSVGAYALHANDVGTKFAFHYSIKNADGQTARGSLANGDQTALTLRKGDTLSLSVPSSSDVYSLMVEAVLPHATTRVVGRPLSPPPSTDDVCALNNTDALTECWSLPWRSTDRYNITLTNPGQSSVTYFLFNPDGSRSPDYTLQGGASMAHSIRPGDMIFGNSLGAMKVASVDNTNPTGIPLPAAGATCTQPGTTNVEVHACWRTTSVDKPMALSLRNTSNDATYEIRNSDGQVSEHAIAAGHVDAIVMRPSDTLSILTSHAPATLTVEATTSHHRRSHRG